MSIEHFDVLVVGAGISGIGAGYHLKTSCPGRSYAILEGRDAIGGTWDLFRYPGIRSDSDMYTLAYLNETARAHGIDRRIRFRHLVKRASWSSETARWTVEVERGETHELVR